MTMTWNWKRDFSDIHWKWFPILHYQPTKKLPTYQRAATCPTTIHIKVDSKQRLSLEVFMTFYQSNNIHNRCRYRKKENEATAGRLYCWCLLSQWHLGCLHVKLQPQSPSLRMDEKPRKGQDGFIGLTSPPYTRHGSIQRTRLSVMTSYIFFSFMTKWVKTLCLDANCSNYILELPKT